MSDLKGRALDHFAFIGVVRRLGFEPSVAALRAQCNSAFAYDAWRSRPLLIRRSSPRQGVALPLSYGTRMEERLESTAFPLGYVDVDVVRSTGIEPVWSAIAGRCVSSTLRAREWLRDFDSNED